MGAGTTKDGYIDMFVETKQPFYTAGTYVDGNVFINCKGLRNYRQLILRLAGVEYVHWSEGHGKHRRTYTNRKQSYNAQFDLAIFADGVIAGGHYSFPFRFLLPAEFSGSMFESESCYIRYPLTAELISSDGKNDLQIYTKYLNVLQPIRAPIGLIQKQQIISPQCCGCCMDYGMVKVGLSCDKNFIRSNDMVQVSGYIDNSGGKDQITHCEIALLDMRWKISSGGAQRKNIIGNHIFYVIPEIIQKGENKQFKFNAVIPPGMVYSTSIGAIVSRYQVLNFHANTGCCTGGLTCQIPLVFHSGTQKIQVGPQIPPPPGWNPIIANQVLYNNLPPFIYQPNLRIPCVNREGKSNMVDLNLMNNQQGYQANQQTMNTMY